MAFESFYGGRPGASLVIVKRYEGENGLSPYDQMVAEFKRGVESTSEVNQNEYVVIDNVDDPDHGKVYKRGVDYNSEDGGAFYVGNMTGPKGEPGGIHILGLVSSTSALTGPPEVMGGNEKYAGQVMAVGAQDTIPDLYAYNYMTNRWFYFGNLPYAAYTITRQTVDYDDAL